MLFVRRGYILLLTGILIGFFAFSIISSLYSVNLSSIGGDKPTEIGFSFLYTSEKQGWIEEVTPMFEDWFKIRFGITVNVQLDPTGTHDSVNRILDGSAKPTVWSPASSIWIPYINTKWQDITGSNNDIAIDWTSIVLSPVVLTSWGSFLEQQPVEGFMDLYNLANQGIDFKYGHPDPLLSNGGTMTVILEFAEAAGKTPAELTIDDLLNETVIEIVRTIESKVINYGKSTGFFGAWAAENGPDAIQFFGIYESVVIDNSLKARSKWDDPLIAIYPEKGTLISDHPFVILNATWINYWQKLAAGEYLFFLLQPNIQELAEQHGFRPAIASVPLDQSLFDPINGVNYEIKIPILKPPKGEVMEAILTAWVRVRNSGI